ncbi:hypothetical protein EDC04DRAFT_2784535, partial [Pisolithus marmoratus]
MEMDVTFLYGIGTPEVIQLVANASANYSPELAVGFIVVCCNDYQVILQLTSSNVQVQVRLIHINLLSRLTMVLSVADPVYHNSGDLSDRPGYDLNQVRSICKVQVCLFPFR